MQPLAVFQPSDLRLTRHDGAPAFGEGDATRRASFVFKEVKGRT
jgi:hypothetical protein